MTTATATDDINDYISRDVELRRRRKRERQLTNVIASFA
jgi:hypothetical protein